MYKSLELLQIEKTGHLVGRHLRISLMEKFYLLMHLNSIDIKFNYLFIYPVYSIDFIRFF